MWQTCRPKGATTPAAEIQKLWVKITGHPPATFPRTNCCSSGQPRFSQILPGNWWIPAILWGFGDVLGEPGCSFVWVPGFPGRTWVVFSAILRDFREFLGEPGWKRLGISWAWENLGGLRRTWADLDGVFLNKPRICKPEQNCTKRH